MCKVNIWDEASRCDICMGEDYEHTHPFLLGKRDRNNWQTTRHACENCVPGVTDQFRLHQMREDEYTRLREANASKRAANILKYGSWR